MKEKTNASKLKEDYLSPSLKKQFLQIEGVLCSSTKNPIGGWQWEDGFEPIEF